MFRLDQRAEDKHSNRTEGQRLLQTRHYAEAESYLTVALGEKHSRKYRAEILAQLSMAQMKQNKLAEAEESARAALFCAKDHASEWQAGESLVAIQIAQGNTVAAIATMAAMEDAEESRPKPDLRRLAASSRQRGKLLLEAGRTKEGLAALDESAQFSVNAWGPEALETAHSLAEIGGVLSQTGHLLEEQRRLGEALKIYKVTSGYNSAEASLSLRNLAISLEASGDDDRAAAEYERYITASELQIGVDPKTAAGAKIRLGALYIRSGRTDAARELLLPVIRLLDRTTGPELAEALQLMATADEQAGRRQDAAQWRAQAARLNIA